MSRGVAGLGGGSDRMKPGETVLVAKSGVGGDRRKRVRRLTGFVQVCVRLPRRYPAADRVCSGVRQTVQTASGGGQDEVTVGSGVRRCGCVQLCVGAGQDRARPTRLDLGAASSPASPRRPSCCCTRRLFGLISRHWVMVGGVVHTVQ